MNCTMWPMEAVIEQDNTVLNNLSVIPSRNVALSRAGAIHGLGRPMFD